MLLGLCVDIVSGLLCCFDCWDASFDFVYFAVVLVSLVGRLILLGLFAVCLGCLVFGFVVYLLVCLL